MRKKLLGAAAVLTGLLTFGAAPKAAVLTTLSPTTNFTYAYTTSGGALLDGMGSITASGFNTNSLSLAVTLTNDAPADARLTSFGFGIDPNATSVTFQDNDLTGLIAASLSSIPSLATIEVCAFGGNNCSGGGNGGILSGGTDAFTLLLAGTFGSSVNIEPIGFKFQTAAGSFEFTTTTTNVPEPMSLALFGAGLLGLGLTARRRKNANTTTKVCAA